MVTTLDNRGFATTDRDRRCPFDPSARLVEMREADGPTPVHLNEREFGEVDMLVFSRHEEVRTLLGDARFQFGFIDGTQMYDTMAGFMPHRHGSEHARLRRAIAAPFTPKHVRMMQSAIERVVEEALDVLEQAGPGADLVSKFTLPVPSRIIGEILGVPSADHLKFNEIAAGITDTSLSPEGYMAAIARLGEYVDELVAQNHRNPSDGLLGDLVQRLNGEISDEEISGLVSTLVVGGHETTAAMLSLSALALMEEPGQLAVLLDESRSTGEAVEELLRYMSNTGTFPRAAKEDLTINGHSVKAGEMVLVSLLNANRDPALAEGNPDELDLTRGPVAHVAFGHGVHQCPGQHLARFELEIALPALFRRLPTLKLAVPREDLEFNRSGIIYGLKELPVKW